MVRSMLNIEVVYANPKQQILIHLQVEQGTLVSDAIQKSGILTQFPEIDLNHYKVGIFSKIVLLNAILQEGDRVEIYHPLLVDPKAARVQRAKQQKQLKNLK